MTVRSFLTFEAPGLPDEEAIEGPAPGREYAESLTAGLRAVGIDVQSEVEPHDAYGWSFLAAVDGVPIWCMLQASDAWLVITKPSVNWWSRLKREPGEAQHLKLCEAVDEVVRRLPQVSAVRWYTEQEFKRGQAGAERP